MIEEKHPFVNASVNELNISNIVLIIFGIPDDDIRSEFEELLNYNHMRYIDGLRQKKVVII